MILLEQIIAVAVFIMMIVGFIINDKKTKKDKKNEKKY